VTAPLVFVSGAAATDFDVDDNPLRGELLTDAQVAALPKAWDGPLTTPARDGDGTLGYASEKPASFAFVLAIPPGKHELAVRYTARPATSSRSGPRSAAIATRRFVCAPRLSSARRTVLGNTSIDAGFESANQGGWISCRWR
jgi:hypothetical protein